MAQHNDLGRWGEDIAAEYLKQKGWYIRHRDWRCGHRDIDIVAIDEDSSLLLIVEVKTRASMQWGEPDEAIDLEKKNNLIMAASHYVRDYHMEWIEVRYDTISVVGTPDTTVSIEHKENAYDVTHSFYYYQEERKKNHYNRKY